MDKHAFRKFTYIQWLLWKKLFVLGTTKKHDRTEYARKKFYCACHNYSSMTVVNWKIHINCNVMHYDTGYIKTRKIFPGVSMNIVFKGYIINVWKWAFDIFIIQIWTWKKASILFSQKMNATFSLFTQQSALFYSIEFFKFKYLLVPFYSAN